MRFLDNVFVERLWRRLKYESVYLLAWEDASEANAGVGQWIEFYNRKRPLSALGAPLLGRGLIAEKGRNPTRSAGPRVA
ncbi:hypothetical protein E4Z66_11085 [Aliishimia ponticola]|uniref:Integrase catalytic domain-containing protein n=1 Tax=Aliishimia ponticola TaxID=2499833 RepID=A0A4S4NDB8_9RHOB|nr:hypothetical protein E4Z66_11085 [Aliishimia ponticola]